MGLADQHIETIYDYNGTTLVPNALHTFPHSHVTKGTLWKWISS